MITADHVADALGERDAAMGDPYPVHCLPAATTSFVQAVSESMQVDESAVATLCLPVLAGCIGNAARIRIKPGWTEPCVLWSCCVMSSGQRKTPVLNAVTKPLHNWQHEKFEEFDLDMMKYRSAMEYHEIDMKAWRKAPSGSPPVPPPKPVCKRIVTGDATIEALAKLLVENPRGMTLVRDELSGLFASLNQYKTTGDDESKLLELYGAGPLVIDRRSAPPMRVPQAACSICGGIQPGVLARILSPERFENGLAARFLYAMPEERLRKWVGTGITPFATTVWSDIVLKLLAVPVRQTPHMIPLSRGALAAFSGYVDRIGVMIDGVEDDRIKATLSKIEGAAARMALIHHAVESDELGDEIPEASMHAGIELALWYAYEAIRVIGAADSDATALLHGKVLEFIRRKSPVAMRDLVSGIRDVSTVEEAMRICEALAADGLVVIDGKTVAIC